MPTPKTELTAERIASEKAFAVKRYEDWAKDSAKPMIDSTVKDVMLTPSGIGVELVGFFRRSSREAGSG